MLGPDVIAKSVHFEPHFPYGHFQLVFLLFRFAQAFLHFMAFRIQPPQGRFPLRLQILPLRQRILQARGLSVQAAESFPVPGDLLRQLKNPALTGSRVVRLGIDLGSQQGQGVIQPGEGMQMGRSLLFERGQFNLFPREQRLLPFQLFAKRLPSILQRDDPLIEVLFHVLRGFQMPLNVRDSRHGLTLFALQAFPTEFQGPDPLLIALPLILKSFQVFPSDGELQLEPVNLRLQLLQFRPPFQHPGACYFLLVRFLGKFLGEIIDFPFQLGDLPLVPKKASLAARPVAPGQHPLGIDDVPVRRDKGPAESVLLP